MVVDFENGQMRILGVPWGLWTFAAGYSVALFMWGVHADDRISALEKAELKQDAQIERIGNETVRRINDLDANGTRQLALVADRQSSIARRLDSVDQRVDAILKVVVPKGIGAP